MASDDIKSKNPYLISFIIKFTKLSNILHLPRHLNKILQQAISALKIYSFTKKNKIAEVTSLLLGVKQELNALKSLKSGKSATQTCKGYKQSAKEATDSISIIILHCNTMNIQNTYN